MLRTTRKEIREQFTEFELHTNIYDFENLICSIYRGESSPLTDSAKEIYAAIRNRYPMDYVISSSDDAYSSGVYGCNGKLVTCTVYDKQWDTVETFKIKYC